MFPRRRSSIDMVARIRFINLIAVGWVERSETHQPSCLTRDGFRCAQPILPPSFVRASLLLHHALQRMLVFARKVHHLRHLGFRDLVRKYAAFADAVMMD